MSASPSPRRLEECCEFWARVARENGWYKEPFFVQAWVDANGDIIDSVSPRDLPRDYILDEDAMPI